MDNRLSGYSMKMGKCEVTGNFLHGTLNFVGGKGTAAKKVGGKGK